MFLQNNFGQRILDQKFFRQKIFLLKKYFLQHCVKYWDLKILKNDKNIYPDTQVDNTL